MLKRIMASHHHNLLVSQGLLNGIGSAIALAYLANQRSAAHLVFCLLAASAGLFVASYAMQRKDISAGLASRLFLLNLLPVYGLLWTMEALAASRGAFWVPFRAHELSCLTVALLAPPFVMLGMLEILAFPALAVLQFWAFDPGQIARTPAMPLMAPLAFGAFALVLYLFRRSGLRISREAADREAEVRLMRAVTKSFLAIKDRANSPIQALTLDVELLRRKIPGEPQLVERLSRSVAKLRELNLVLDEQARAGEHGLRPPPQP